MADVGRNDPCPCGSGRKYKHCCRKKDKAKRLENRTTPPPGAEPANAMPTPSFMPSSGAAEPDQSAPSQVEERERSPAVEAWTAFKEMEYEEQLAYVEEIIGDEERMDTENAFEMFNQLYDKAAQRGERRRLTALIDRLAEIQPDVYEAEAPFLIDWQLHAAVSEDRLDEVLDRQGDVLALLASKDIDKFELLADLLAYHGRREHLTAALVEAWPAVRDDGGVMPHGVAEFSWRAIRYVIFQHFEAHGAVDLDDPALRERLDALDVPDEERVEVFADALSGRLDGTWSLDDFQEEDEAAERATFTLCTAFTGHLFREYGVPCTKGDLAAQALEPYFNRRRSGKYETSDNPPVHPLCPDRKSFWAFLSDLGSFVSYQAHRAAATVELTPRWVAFLDAQGLADERCTAALRVLHHVAGHVQERVSQFSEDATLPRAVAQAWEKLEA